MRGIGIGIGIKIEIEIIIPNYPKSCNHHGYCTIKSCNHRRELGIESPREGERKIERGIIY